MKKILILFLLVACSEIKSENALAPKDFDAKYKSTENAIIVDVRTEFEFKEGALPGAINIVYGLNFEDKLVNLEKKPIFVYCRTGGRAAKASSILREKGYEVYELEGGLKAWETEGLPVEEPAL